MLARASQGKLRRDKELTGRQGELELDRQLGLSREPEGVQAMMKKAISLLLAAGLALSAVPGGAEVFGPNTIWGSVPQGQEGVTNAVLLDASGKAITMVPVVDGKFAFRDAAPGEYTVGLYTASGQQVARACPLQLSSGSELEALFTCGRLPAAPVTKGGISTTAWILMGAAAVGITTAVVIASDEDEGTASPIR